MLDAGRRVRLAVDVMGGDHAPEDIIKGAVKAARKEDIEIILVGPTDVVKRELAKRDTSHVSITHVRADEVINEDEHPAFAVRRKPNASITVAMELVKAGKADAIISAGPTGAASISAIKSLGMIPGIQRPAVCVPLVGFAPNTVLVDGGANVDCKPYHLLSFAVIGSIYVKKLLNILDPKIALLSIGTEESKGNRLIQESYPLLQSSGLNFIGNIEGGDILSGRANVIVCDAIIGNVLMKFYESLGYYIVEWLKNKLDYLPLAGGPVKKLLEQLRLFTKITKNESDRGGLLWGVNGVVHLLHGNSKAQQVNKAIAQAKYAAETDIVGSLRSELAIIRNACTNYPNHKIKSQGTLCHQQ
jgi:fatty acid/phospholipid synthesis protein PlsX